MTAAEPFLNHCRFVAAAAGTAAFTVASAAPTDAYFNTHDVPENCNVIDGNVYRYYAQTDTQNELGSGVYSVSTHTLARTHIFGNSDGTAVPLNFATAPTVDVFVSPATTLDVGSFPLGTKMLFQNATAPLGWTKQTTFNDVGLRIVSGTPGSGGSTAFSTVFSQSSVGNTSLSIAQLAPHQHTPASAWAGFNWLEIGPSNVGNPFDGPPPGGASTWSNFECSYEGATSVTGSGSPHAHTIALQLAYVDFIIAARTT